MPYKDMDKKAAYEEKVSERKKGQTYTKQKRELYLTKLRRIRGKIKKYLEKKKRKEEIKRIMEDDSI